MSGGNRLGGVRSGQRQLETTSLEPRPIPLLAAPQPLRRSVSGRTCEPQHASTEAQKKWVRSLFIVRSVGPSKISLLTREGTLMRLKAILNEKTLIILFLFYFSVIFHRFSSLTHLELGGIVRRL